MFLYLILMVQSSRMDVRDRECLKKFVDITNDSPEVFINDNQSTFPADSENTLFEYYGRIFLCLSLWRQYRC